MSAHNIGFYEELRNYPLIIIKYHQIHTLPLLLPVSTGHIADLRLFFAYAKSRFSQNMTHIRYIL